MSARDVIAGVFRLQHRDLCYPDASSGECLIAADAIIAELEASGRSIVHKDEIHAPSVERINAKAEQIMLKVVNEWHRQVGIDEILKSKLTKRIADTVATGVFAAALRELMKEVG